MTFEAEPNSPARKPINPLLKLLLELGPLGIFFLANARGESLAAQLPWIASLGGPIFFATAAFIVATLIALAVSLAITRTLPIMPFITGIVVVIFGGLTLWLQDDTFIKLKVTIINALFGGILLGGLAFGKPLLGYVFDAVFKLTEEGWRKLTFRWGLFFLALAVLNEVVWRSVPTDTWVDFKVFGIAPLTFVFTLTQLPLINRYQVKEETTA
ncbi:MAG TPA: septation protein A [Bauldia sp.]|nr:septation protein A [Bauldia sp.]